MTLVYCLMCAYMGCLWRGDLDEAAEHLEKMSAYAVKYSVSPYRALAAALRAQLEIARGEFAVGVGPLREALATLPAEQHFSFLTAFSRALAEGLAQTGDHAEAIATIDAALAWTEQTGAAFDVPELLRVKGQIMLSSSNSSTESAEQVLLQALTVAREQSALGWELRSAIALARLWAGQGRPDAARKVLRDCYLRFTEGFTTADLKMAAQLLKHLGPPT